MFYRGMVHRSFAPDRGVNLRQQGGRHLNKAYAALVAGGRKTGQIANHATAQRNQRGVTAVRLLQ